MSPHKNRKHGVQAHTRTQHSTLRELGASTKMPKENFSENLDRERGSRRNRQFFQHAKEPVGNLQCSKNIQSQNNSICNEDAITDLIAMGKEHESKPRWWAGKGTSMLHLRRTIIYC